MCVHIRTILVVWTGSAFLCNSSVWSWRTRRDALEPVQPHYPKIYSLYLQGNIHIFDVLLKISLLKKQFTPESQCGWWTTTHP